MRVCAIGMCAISALVRPEVTSSNVTQRDSLGRERACANGSCRISDQTSPVGLSLEGWNARMRDRKYHWGVILFVLKPNPKED